MSLAPNDFAASAGRDANGANIVITGIVSLLALIVMALLMAASCAMVYGVYRVGRWSVCTLPCLIFCCCRRRSAKSPAASPQHPAASPRPTPAPPQNADNNAKKD